MNFKFKSAFTILNKNNNININSNYNIKKDFNNNIKKSIICNDNYIYIIDKRKFY